MLRVTREYHCDFYAPLNRADAEQMKLLKKYEKTQTEQLIV